MMLNIKKCIVVELSTILIGSSISPNMIQAIEENKEVSSENFSNGISEEYLESIGIDINSDTYYITDYQMDLIAQELGYDVPSTENSYTARSGGITKIEKVGKGSWNIYFSRSFIKKYYYTGALSSAFIAALIPGIGGAVAGALATFAAAVAGEADSGVYFQVRNWKVTYGGPK